MDDNSEESRLRGLFRRSQAKSFLPGRKSYAPSSQTPSNFLPPLPPQDVTEDSLEQYLTIGDHVCISGVKTGRLLYFGKFMLAEGVWCGIELDEPVGKHDGEVQAVRYFSCKPGHGIFAPLNKVSLVSVQVPELKKDFLNETGKVIRTKLQRRTLAAPKTYSQLSRESSSEKGSVESLSSQSDTGSESSLQRNKTSQIPSGGAESQNKKSRLSFLRKPSAIPKSGGRISPTEEINQTQLIDNHSGLPRPKPIAGKGFGVPVESKLQMFKGKSNPYQQKVSYQNKEQALNSTQIIQEAASAELNATHVVDDQSKVSVEANQTLVIESPANATQTLDQLRDSETSSDSCRSLEKRLQPDDKSGSEQDFKRARISQLPLSKIPKSGSRNNASSESQQIFSKLDGTFTSVHVPLNTTVLVSPQSRDVNGTFNVPEETDCNDEQQAFSPEVHRQLVAGGKHYLNLTFGADQPGLFMQDDLNNIVTSPTYSAKSDDYGGEELSELDSSLEFLKGDRHIGEATRLGILKPEEMEDTHLISNSMLESDVFSLFGTVDPSSQKNLTFDRAVNDPVEMKGVQKQMEATYNKVPSECDSKDFAYMTEASSLGLLQSKYFNSADNTNLLAANPRLQELRRVREKHFLLSTGSDLEEDGMMPEGSSRNRISSLDSDNFDLNGAVITSTPLEPAGRYLKSRLDKSVHEEISTTNVFIGNAGHLEEVRKNLDFTNNACPDDKGKQENENQEIDQQTLPPQGNDLPDNLSNSTASQSFNAKKESGHIDQGSQEIIPTNPVESVDKMPNEMQTSCEFLRPSSKQMTDSGIDNLMTASQEMYASQTSESRSSSSVDKLDQILAERNQLASDLLAGHTKTDRPLSLISSISSVDTGYVPDTGSERGTLTTNSPSDWLEKQGDLHPVHSQKTLTEIYTETFHEQQQGVLRGSAWRGCMDSAMDSDGTHVGPARGQSHITDTGMDVDSNPHNDTMETCTEGENSETESSNDVTEIMVSKRKVDNQMSSDEISESSVETMASEGTDNHDHSSEKENVSEVEEQVLADRSLEIDKAADKSHTEVDSKSKGKSKASKSFIKVDHKKPNVNVGSKLAEYLKTSLPNKSKDEGSESVSKAKKNLSNKKKTNSSLNKTNISSKSEKDDEEVKPRRERVKVVKEPPKIIKRATPKSKWGDIMSTIVANKDTPPKPKERPKSQLEAIFSQPTPPKKEARIETKPKKKLMSQPKPDYSNVKSRLNTGAATPKSNPMTPRSRTASTSSLGVVLHLDLSSSVNGSFNDSVQSAGSSRSDLSGCGQPDGSSSRRKVSGKASNNTTNSLKKQERPLSAASIKSDDVSTNSVKAMNEKNIQKSPRRKAEIKSSIPPIAPLPRRSRSSPAKSTGKTADPSTSKQTSKAAAGVTKRSVSVSSHQNRNKSIKSKTTSNLKSPESEQEKKVKAAEEISRLEALCESRTKELTLIKMQLKSGITAFDAMSALVNYLTQELDAFSCPVIKGKLETVQSELSDTQTQLGCLQELKKTLEEEIVSLNKQHEAVLSSLNSEHSDELLKAKKVLREERDAKIKKLEQSHSKDIDNLRAYHDRHIQEIGFEHEEQIQLLKLSNKEEIQALQRKHDNQMEELHRQHKDSREDITKRFESIKTSLLEKVETLKRECDDLKKRARQSEDALLRDSDVRLQMALEPYKDLPQEIDSLKLVIEMRNDEIRDLRRQKIDTDMQLKELPEAKERTIFLEHLVENLEAVINIKTDHEKQLSDKCQRLLKKCDQENKQNKRLSMNVEELMWKMTESGSDFGSTESLSCNRQLSHSPPSSEHGRRLKSSSSSTDTSYSPAVLRRSGCQTVERRAKRRSYQPSDPPSPNLSVMSKSFNESSLHSAIGSSFSEMDFSDGPHGLPPPTEPPVEQNGLQDDSVKVDAEGPKDESPPKSSVEMKEGEPNGASSDQQD